MFYLLLVAGLLVFASSCKKIQTTSNSQTSSPPEATTPSQLPGPGPAIRIFHGTGIVTKVVLENPYDKTLASVEVNHGEIVGLMPAMRMEFYVKGRSLLDGIKVGDLIDFTIEEKGSSEIISDIRKQ